MTVGHRHDPVDLLLQGVDLKSLLKFLRGLSERMSAAFADANKGMPCGPNERPAIQARGSMRRAFLDRALRRAAADAGLSTKTGWTSPPTWSFPVIGLGAYSATLAMVSRASSSLPRKLRSKCHYLQQLAVRNDVLNPQPGFFDRVDSDVRRVIPDGSLGALFVAEASSSVPDSPVYLGFWVPAPNLKMAFFQTTIDALIAAVQRRMAEQKGHGSRRISVVRKRPMLKPKKAHPPKP